MQISKVDYVRMGVKTDIQPGKGFSYKFPKSYNYKLDEHIKGRVEAAQKLYHILVPEKYDKAQENEKNKCHDGEAKVLINQKYSAYAKFAEYFDKFMVPIVRIFEYNKKDKKPKSPLELEKKQIKRLGEAVRKDIFEGFAIPAYFNDKTAEELRQCAWEMIDIGLINKLRRTYTVRIPEGEIFVSISSMLEDILFALLQDTLNDGKNTKMQEFVQQENGEKIKLLLKILNRSYAIISQEDTKQSIEQQRVKSQVTGEKELLQLSNAESAKKQWLFAFLKEYAAAKAVETKNYADSGSGNWFSSNQLLNDIVKLIVLYYCGVEAYESCDGKEFTAWSFESVIPKQNDKIMFGMTPDKTERCLSEGYKLPHTILEELEEEKENPLSKSDRSRMEQELAVAVRQTMCACYPLDKDRRLKGRDIQMSEKEKYWLQYISRCAEKILLSKPSSLTLLKLNVNYLCLTTMRMFMAYIAEKYVDMGKAVYHFTQTEPSGEIPCDIGKILPEYQNGITSFDYENIKAEDNLDRDLSTYISFAAGVWSHTVCKSKMKDTTSNPLVGKERYERAEENRRILQFFGGRTCWEDINGRKLSEVDLFTPFNSCIRLLRNNRFHYSAEIIDEIDDEQKKICSGVLTNELSHVSDTYRKCMYSNNVWMFYQEKDLFGLMDKLYKQDTQREAYIPSFNRVINDNKLDNVIVRIVDSENYAKVAASGEDWERFRHAIYFMLKEIYYYAFLKDTDCKEKFKAVVKERKEALDAKKNKNQKEMQESQGLKNFLERYNQIDQSSDINLETVCQAMMTDYSRLNQIKEKYSKKEAKYQHFPRILEYGLREALIRYVSDNVGFIKKPQLLDREIAEENFLNGWKTQKYSGLKEKLEADSELMAWYITAHFMNQKTLNQLAGCLKNYNQFIEDICDRFDVANSDILAQDVREAGKAKRAIIEKKKKRNCDIIRVLEFTKLFCGVVSNNWQDYFADEEQYSSVMAKFVDISGYQNLSQFCSVETVETAEGKKSLEQMRLYYNEKELVVNRNLVHAMMYGNIELLSETVKKVDKELIEEYYSAQAKLGDYKKYGQCKSLEELESLKDYQNIKNQVELTNIVIYSELVNDYISQLITWAYMRERDLMYFQLGIHYIIMRHTGVRVAQKYESMEGSYGYYRNRKEDKQSAPFEQRQITVNKGFLLYQIKAMYTYQLPIITQENGELVGDVMQTGRKVGKFTSYCKGVEIYLIGLELFTGRKPLKEADAFNDSMIDLRNYIDHFYYYAEHDRSILELYSEIYNGFFSYSYNFKKSCSYIIRGILTDYFMNACFDFTHGKENPTFSLHEPLSSLMHTHKIEEKGQEKIYKIKARSNTFLEDVERILNYKKE